MRYREAERVQDCARRVFGLEDDEDADAVVVFRDKDLPRKDDGLFSKLTSLFTGNQPA